VKNLKYRILMTSPARHVDSNIFINVI